MNHVIGHPFPETAQRIRDFSNDMKERASDYLDQAKDKVSSTVSRGMSIPRLFR